MSSGNFKIFKTIIFIIVLTFPIVAKAQLQRGYEDSKPNVTIDKTALEDLKDYKPPSMFGSAPSDEVIVTPVHPIAKPTVSIPTKQILTTPHSEDLLKHPVQNFRVLTERTSKENKPEYKKVIKDVEKPKLEKPLEQPIKKATPIKKNEKKKVLAPEPIKTKAYRPQTKQTMPAVPPIKVEKNELPPLSNSSMLPKLPSPVASEEDITAPSIGLRMMDAALERQIESDDIKIKEKLLDTNIKTMTSKQKEKVLLKPVLSKLASNTLIFSETESALSHDLENRIRQFILPDLSSNVQSRIQILSFATSPDKSESNAKRLALTRALAVRDFLKSSNIDVSRIDVRALISPPKTTPANKIDVILLK